MSSKSEDCSTLEHRIAELTVRIEARRSQVDSTNLNEWLKMFRQREALEKLLSEGDR
jgi:hypothetical protein